MRVGIEVGGTFTDLVAVDGSRVEVIKVPSTPASPDKGAFASLEAAGLDPAVVTDLVHGSTVATNAILERKGARVAFVTTRGFRDILFFQRHDRRNIYDLRYAKPLPPVRRRDCLEITERLDSAGMVVTPLDEAEVASVLVPALKAGGYEAVAICLLSAYISPVHETRLRQLISAALPGLRVACSHDIAREFREFERASTTVLSAYVQPVIDGYLDRFEATLAAAGFKGAFSVMQSNGGRMPAAAMRKNSIAALFSGPAAGVVGAIRQAERSGRKNLITFDMGGTSTDVCLVVEGVPSVSAETEVDGLPIRTPVLKRDHRSGEFWDAGARHCERWRRWRFAGVDRRRRHAAGWSAERGRDAGAGLLWPWRHGADRDRRASCAWHDPPGSVPRRHHASRRRQGAQGI